MSDDGELYGMIGQMKAAPGKRAELLGYLTEASGEMLGNLLYLVAEDVADADALWVTEIWIDRAAHAASLQPPAVKSAIARARPILAGFGTSAEIRPVSGLS
ncbi:antibiotic biosynthesis monooxygenase [Sphingomonas sp. HDW15A]|uniref:putative quinol monooxygenase n=1 Tax=Sphingomonas sp. HDW15A TaxID=2714942 RepID=UPI001F0DFA5E|nr:antibiotic biosynthesis monooxygenase [Sphingomonas sp. HDW15A]